MEAKPVREGKHCIICGAASSGRKRILSNPTGAEGPEVLLPQDIILGAYSAVSRFDWRKAAGSASG